jgi:hypothetical protein
MAGLYVPFKVYTPGEVLTAADLNATDQNHITNQTPPMTDDYSADLTQKRQQVDPANSLATSLAAELQQIRFVLARLGARSYWDEVTGPAGASGGKPGVQQMRALVIGGDSTITLTTDVVTFSDGVVKISNVHTLNLAIAGPAAGGRDQAANFQNQWINIWYIYNPTTTNVALTATATVHTKQPPALPFGYTSYCYATSLPIGATANQFWSPGRAANISGSHVYWHPPINVLPITGTIGAGPETAVAIGSAVPWDRTAGCSYRLFVDVRPSVNVTAVGNVCIRAFPGVNTAVYWVEHGMAPGQPARGGGGSELTMPVWYSTFWYQLTASSGEIDAIIDVMSFQVPNGDS